MHTNIQLDMTLSASSSLAPTFCVLSSSPSPPNFSFLPTGPSTSVWSVGELFLLMLCKMVFDHQKLNPWSPSTKSFFLSSHICDKRIPLFTDWNMWVYFNMHCTHDRISQISICSHRINPTKATNLIMGLIIRVTKSQSEHDYLYITLFIVYFFTHCNYFHESHHWSGPVINVYQCSWGVTHLSKLI